MSAVDQTKIIVLHNDPVARAGLAATFSNRPCFEILHSASILCGTVRGVEDARSTEDHVVVADYPNGVAIALQIAHSKARLVHSRIVIVTGNDCEYEIRCALELGVKGYLLVGCELEELVAGVHAVSRGLRYLCPKTASRLAESVSAEALSPREEEVLRLVVTGSCNKVIGRRLGIAVGTVKSHLKSIFGKLAVCSRTQAIAAAQRRGLLCNASPRDGSEGQSESRVPAMFLPKGLSQRSTIEAGLTRASSTEKRQRMRA